MKANCRRIVTIAVGSALLTTVLLGNAGGAPPPKAAPVNNNAATVRSLIFAQQMYALAYRQAAYQSAMARMNMARAYAPPAPRYNNRGNNMAMMNAYARAMANMYGNPNATGGFTDYICTPADEATVRRYRLPTRDENGEPKKYSAEELKELKGDDPKLIGYNASYSDLQVGQTCRVTLCRKRVDPKNPDKVSYVPVNTYTGTLQKIDDNSLKQFTLRVRGAATPAYAQRQNNNNNQNREVPADPDKFATLIVIYSDAAAQMAANN